jgi:hypothetical protein
MRCGPATGLLFGPRSFGQSRQIPAKNIGAASGRANHRSARGFGLSGSGSANCATGTMQRCSTFGHGFQNPLATFRTLVT